MQANVERDRLVKALSAISRVVERRNTIPILSNVLLAARAGEDGQPELALTGTDLDLTMALRVPLAEMAAPGEITVPAATLADIARKIPQGAQIALEAQEGARLAVRAGRSRFVLNTLPREDFPDVPEPPASHAFDIAAADLQRLLERTAFAVSTEETRFYLNGHYLHRHESGLRAVATDGHRLACVTVAAPPEADGLPGIIVPRKTAAELRKLAEDTPSIVRLEIGENAIRARAGAIVLASKVIDGTYPDYERVIPSANERRVEADKATLAASVERVTAVSTDRSRGIRLGLVPGALALSARNADVGDARDEIDAEHQAGEIEIGFNGRYVLDTLAQIEGERVAVLLGEEGGPALIADASGDSPDIFVVMPMRV